MKSAIDPSQLHSGLMPRSARLESELNVTPLVDVMLVLLIIFMVSAPLMTVGLPVDLPQAALDELTPEPEPLNVIIAPGGVIQLGDVDIKKDAFAAALTRLAADTRKQRVRIRADRSVIYDDVMFVMSALSESGFSRIGLMAMPKPEGSGP